MVPCLALAMDCAKSGGTAAAVMSAANEEAVSLFLREKIAFNDIFDAVSQAVDTLAQRGTPSLDDLRQADGEARIFVRERFKKHI